MITKESEIPIDQMCIVLRAGWGSLEISGRILKADNRMQAEAAEPV
jgi:hypothetical protein